MLRSSIAGIISGGGELYAPRMMSFSGTSYYNDIHTDSGSNAVTAVQRVNLAPSLNARQSFRNSKTHIKMRFYIFPSNSATYPNMLQVSCYNSSGVRTCLMYSDTAVATSDNVHIFAEYDGTAGTGKIYIDGVDALDAVNSVITTGTMETGVNCFMGVGADNGGSLALESGDEAGMFGYKCVSGLDPADFYDPVTGLVEIDETGWGAWSGQPLYWQKEGDMSVENLGSISTMTKNGTITGPA